MKRGGRRGRRRGEEGGERGEERLQKEAVKEFAVVCLIRNTVYAKAIKLLSSMASVTVQ